MEPIYAAPQDKATDVIPENILALLGELPEWALQRASEILYPECPPPGVLYQLPAGRKVFLQYNIAKALVEARTEALTEVALALGPQV